MSTGDNAYQSGEAPARAQRRPARAQRRRTRPSTCVLQRPSSRAASSFNNTTLHQRLDDKQRQKKHPQISENTTPRQKSTQKLSDDTTRKTNNRKTETDGVCTENTRGCWEERRIVSHTSRRWPSCIDAGLLPSAPRTSHALKAQGPRCASAARRADPCKTAPASCRHPGTRTR